MPPLVLKTNPTDERFRGKYPLLSISTTGAAQYLDCGLKWKLGSIDRLTLKRPKVHFPFGTAFHAGARPFWHGGETNFKKEWQKSKAKDIDYGKSSWLEYFRKGERMTEELVLALAKKFLPTETRTEVNADIDLGFVTVTRRIDVVTVAQRMPILLDGLETKTSKPLFLDLKSARSKYTAESVERSQQLLTYGIGPDKKPIKDSLAVFAVVTKTLHPQVQIIGKRFDEKEIKGQVNRLRDVVRGIRGGYFPQVKGDHCGYCDFAALCYSKPGWESMYEYRARHRPGPNPNNDSGNSVQQSR